jgi:hypothetical protein
VKRCPPKGEHATNDAESTLIAQRGFGEHCHLIWGLCIHLGAEVTPRRGADARLARDLCSTTSCHPSHKFMSFDV